MLPTLARSSFLAFDYRRCHYPHLNLSLPSSAMFSGVAPRLSVPINTHCYLANLFPASRTYTKFKFVSCRTWLTSILAPCPVVSGMIPMVPVAPRPPTTPYPPRVAATNPYQLSPAMAIRPIPSKVSLLAPLQVAPAGLKILPSPTALPSPVMVPVTVLPQAAHLSTVMLQWVKPLVQVSQVAIIPLAAA